MRQLKDDFLGDENDPSIPSGDWFDSQKFSEA